MKKQYYPFYDADLNNKITALVGENKQLVFDAERMVYLAEKNVDNQVVSFTPIDYMAKEVVELIQQHQDAA